MADENLSKLFRIRRTVCEMLYDRGYLVTESELSMTKDEFIRHFGDDPKHEDLTMLKHKKSGPADEIYVFFPAEEKLGVKQLKDSFFKRMKEENVYRAIIVLQKPLTSFARNTVAQMAPKYIMEIFQEGELLVNVTKHELVPKHHPLSDEEKKTLLERYTVKESQLPRMQKSDPVARYLGLTRGQVVQITRISETAGKYINYRLVV